MKKTKTKLTAILMSICCVLAIFGFSMNVWSTSQTAKADGIPTVTVASEVYESTATTFYMATRGTVDVEGNWDDAIFVLTSGTGNGATLNGNALEGFRLRKVDVYWLEDGGTVGVRWYVDFTTEAVAGDKLVIDGTYHFASDETKAVDFDNVTFEYDGTKWFAVSTSDLHQVGKLTPGNVDTETNMYFNLENGIPSEDVSWEIRYDAEDDAVVTINDNPVSISLKVVNNDSAYLEFTQAPQEGDVFVIEGTFACEALASKINIAQSKFVWNGEAWENVYARHEIGALELHGNSKGAGGAAKQNNVVYLARVDGQALPVLSWADAFVADNAENFKINGEPVTPASIKSTGDGFYWEFGTALNAGDDISISGTFRCPSQGVRYVIEESRFTWTGERWEPYVDYATHELGQVVFLKVNSATQLNMMYFYRADERPIPRECNEDTAWNTWFYVLPGSGEGITLNGERAELGIKFPGDMFLEFAQAPQEDDVLVIEGTLYSSELAIKYVIEKSEFIWKDGAYITMLDYEKNLLKEELNEYFDDFAEADYYDDEWELLSQRLADGLVAINEASDLDEAEEALADAKEALDEVLTKEEVDAIIGEARTQAKAELATYVSEEDYHDAEWAQIQAIITQANEDIDDCQSISGLATIVADAQDEIDEVKTAEEVDAEALATAKTQAKAEVRDYYNALNLDDYSDESNALLAGFVTTANTAIDNATTVAEVQTALSQFKTSVDAVEKLSPSSTGCAGSVGGLIALTPALALALGMIIRKKRED